VISLIDFFDAASRRHNSASDMQSVW